MKDYDKLTQRGRERRLRHLAEAAIGQYDLDVVRFELVGRDTNLVYRLRTRDGQSYALRLASPNWRTESDLKSEAMWLEALENDTTIPAPRVIRATDGAAVIECVAQGVPTARYATLMSWLPGVPLERHLNESNLEKLGELFAKLHLHGAEWQPPSNFTTRTFDRFLSRGEPDVLLATVQQGDHTPRTLATLEQMHSRVAAAYAALDPADVRVIHCDLWHGNVKLHRGVLHPFDFEDTVLGYRLHDIAMAMLDLFEEGDAAHYEDLLAAFRSGYERRMEWPDGDMAALQIGRMLWRLNLFARYDQQQLTDNLALNLPLFERYLESGEVLPSSSPKDRE